MRNRISNSALGFVLWAFVALMALVATACENKGRDKHTIPTDTDQQELVDSDGDGCSDRVEQACGPAAVRLVNVHPACGDVPAAAEECDGVDNDCNGPVDDTNGNLIDTDDDGIADCRDTDDDGDGSDDDDDCEPLDPAIRPGIEEVCDGFDNNCDDQADGQGSRGCTVFILDSDRDGFGSIVANSTRCLCAPAENFDAEQGGDCDDARDDVFPNAEELCDGRDNDCDGTLDDEGEDADGDDVADCRDTDDDGDGIPDDLPDNCLGIANPGQANMDGDAFGDACDPDIDGDNIPNGDDNCRLIANANQANADGDNLGDACDDDRDGDGVNNNDDNCPGIQNPGQENMDDDNEGDACDMDLDGDGRENGVDNCPDNANADQANNDGDALGDVCDADDDNDGVNDVIDNCDFVANANQADADRDNLGDACDNLLDSDGDGYAPCVGPIDGSCDCDDRSANINPDVVFDECDGVDNDCDGTRDEFPSAATGQNHWFDEDSDGHGTPNRAPLLLCQPDFVNRYSATRDSDCDDRNANINPQAGEICRNGVDDDCNLNTSDLCGPPPPPPAPERACADGVDNDNDGRIDCADGDCAAAQACVVEVCNGQDDNGNGQTDEGNLCGAGNRCAAGRCEPIPPPPAQCGAGDPCPAGQTCSTLNRCVAIPGQAGTLRVTLAINAADLPPDTNQLGLLTECRAPGGGVSLPFRVHASRQGPFGQGVALEFQTVPQGGVARCKTNLTRLPAADWWAASCSAIGVCSARGTVSYLYWDGVTAYEVTGVGTGDNGSGGIDWIFAPGTDSDGDGFAEANDAFDFDAARH